MKLNPVQNDQKEQIDRKFESSSENMNDEFDDQRFEPKAEASFAHIPYEMECAVSQNEIEESETIPSGDKPAKELSSLDPLKIHSKMQ